MRSKNIYLILAASFALVGGGLLFPFWPLSVLGVALAAFARRFVFTVCMGILLDLAWGAPTGMFSYFFFPMTALSLLFVLARIVADRYFLRKNFPDTL